MCESDKNRKPKNENNKMKIEANEGGWENPKLGMHQAVCVDDLDMGEVDTAHGKKRKIKLMFLLDQKRSDGKPMVIGRTYNATLDPKGFLRRDLKGWRGGDLSPEEVKNFDTNVLVGVQAQVNITEYQKGDGTPGTQIETILPPADGQSIDGSSYEKKGDPDW